MNNKFVDSVPCLLCRPAASRRRGPSIAAGPAIKPPSAEPHAIFDFDQIAAVAEGAIVVLSGLSDSAPMVLSFLGYFLGMIAVFTAAVAMMLGFSNISALERARHYPRAVVERNVTAANREPRLFMVVPETKDRSPAKNMEANSAAAPTEKTVARKSRPHKPTVRARQRNNYERPGYGNALGYIEASRNGPQRLYGNW